MPRLTLTLQDGAVTTLPFERDLDEAEAVAFIEGYGDGQDAIEDGHSELESGRTYDTSQENEAYDSGANVGLAFAKWGGS